MGFEDKAYRLLFLRKGFLVLVVVICLLTVGFFAVQRGVYVPNVSAVTTSPSLGVYWDQACTKPVSSINWGNVSAAWGSEKDVVVFVKNLGSNATVLSMNMSALNPSSAYLKMYLCWNYGGQKLASGSVANVTLSLFVTPLISGVSSFSFNVNIAVGLGLNKSPDINRDGVVNALDAAILAKAWGTWAGEPNYDYRCDFYNDGIINILDGFVIAAHWLQTTS
jgi:hypothetical protein